MFQIFDKDINLCLNISLSYYGTTNTTIATTAPLPSTTAQQQEVVDQLTQSAQITQVSSGNTCELMLHCTNTNAITLAQ